MAGKDNTLGAPTEGLGQTVTFAAGGGGGVPQTTSSRRGNEQLDNRGGGAELTARALQVPPAKPNATMTALFQLGGELVRPAVEQEKNQAYIDGIQKAASGEAISEIVQEQPWYSKLFGSTSLVDGARAYTASTKANSVATDMEASMEDLRKMTGPEFAKYSAEQLVKHKTGDSTTDAMIVQQLTSVLPGVMKGQAKAHLRYQQETLENGIGDNATAAFALLGTVDAQARKPGATKETADTLEAGINVLNALTPPATMNPKVFERVIAERGVSAISGGNFALYHVLDESGRLDAMDAQHQNALRTAYHQASNRAKSQLPADMLTQRAQWAFMSSEPGTTDEQIVAGAQAINNSYTMATGDKSPLIPGATTTQELVQRRVAEQHRLNQLAHAAATENRAAQKAQLHQQLIGGLAANVGSNPNYYMGGADITDKQRAEVWNELRIQKKPEDFAAVLVAQAGQRTLDPVTQDLVPAAAEMAVRAGDRNALYRAYTEKYLPLVKASGDLGEVVAQQYAGRMGDLFARYHKLAGGQPADATQQAIFYEEATRPLPKPIANEKHKKEVTAALSTGIFMKTFGAIGLSDTVPTDNPDKLADLIAPRLDLHLKTEDAVGKALRNSPDLSVIGGKYWTKGTQDTRLDAWVAANPVVHGIASDNLHKASRYSFDKYAEEAGIDGSHEVGQTFDKVEGTRRVPQFYVMGTGADGKTKIKTFTADDMNANWANRAEHAKQEQAKQLEAQKQRDIAEARINARAAQAGIK